jgi:hypothetical protein
MYYNTTNESGAQLKESHEKAHTQDEHVAALYETWGAAGLTPSMAWKKLIGTGKIDKHTPLTSIRRSITSLTKKGVLYLTTRKENGHYGKREGVWEFSKKLKGGGE